jgi:hypothetical protein
VASLLPGRRIEINIYASADIDSWFLPDLLTLTHGFCRQGPGNGVPGGEPAAGAALPLPGAGLQQGRRRTLVLTPGGHLRYRTIAISTYRTIRIPPLKTVRIRGCFRSGFKKLHVPSGICPVTRVRYPICTSCPVLTFKGTSSPDVLSYF